MHLRFNKLTSVFLSASVLLRHNIVKVAVEPQAAGKWLHRFIKKLTSICFLQQDPKMIKYRNK